MSLIESSIGLAPPERFLLGLGVTAISFPFSALLIIFGLETSILQEKMMNSEQTGEITRTTVANRKNELEKRDTERKLHFIAEGNKKTEMRSPIYKRRGPKL